MIEGTRSRNPQSPDPSTTNSSEKPQEETKMSSPNAVNLERRAWFGQLIPAFGASLVKILRESNNLQSDLREALRAQLAEDEERQKKD